MILLPKRQEPDAPICFVFVVRLYQVARNIGCRNEAKMVDVDSHTTVAGDVDYMTDHTYELASDDTYFLAFEALIFLRTEVLVGFIGIEPAHEGFHLFVGDDDGNARNVQPAVGIGLNMIEMMEVGELGTTYVFLHLVDGAMNEEDVVYGIDEFSHASKLVLPEAFWKEYWYLMCSQMVIGFLLLSIADSHVEPERFVGEK